MPSARFYSEGNISFGINTHKPYTRMSINAYPFNWMEAIYHYTDIRDRLYSPVFAFSGNQTYKDKGFDIKLRVLKEKKFLPQVAVGFRDLAGSSFFSAEYIAASKFYKGIDFTMGMAWGTLSNDNFKNPATYIQDSFAVRPLYYLGEGGEVSTKSFFRGAGIGIFGGLEAYSRRFKGLRYKLEYDSTNYELEGKKPQRLDSRVNYGFSLNINENFNISLGYVRGNTFQFGFNISGNFSQKTKSLKKSQPPVVYKNSDAIQKATSIEERYLYLAALRYLKDEKVNVRSVNIEESKIALSYSQSRFSNYSQAYGRIFNILDQISPEYINEFELVSKNRTLALSRANVSRDDFKLAQLTANPILLHNSISYSDTDDLSALHEYQPKLPYPVLFWDLTPDYTSHIGGADRFFAGSADVSLNLESVFSDSLSFIVSARYPIYSTLDVIQQGSDSILPHVRTDIVDYLSGSNSGISIPRAQLNYFHQFNENIYFKLSGGLLESMFGGAGFEVLYRPMFSNFAIGIEGFHAIQRDFDQKFYFRNYKTNTGHATFYYHEPSTDILFTISGGRYLAEDSGFTFDFSRQFSSGLEIGAFFTRTDISKEEFGEGSFDKGFYFSMPIDTFIGNYSRKRSGFSLRPLTRDGGQKLMHGFSLWGITDEASFNSINMGRYDYFE